MRTGGGGSGGFPKQLAAISTDPIKINGTERGLCESKRHSLCAAQRRSVLRSPPSPSMRASPSPDSSSLPGQRDTGTVHRVVVI